MLKVVFLDKDGTLVKNIPYNVDPDRLEFLPGVVHGLRKIHQLGYSLVVVSNQSGVARGYFKEDDLAGMWERLEQMLKQEGIPLLDIFYCPHHPDGKEPSYTKECECRKPEPGLIYLAGQKYNLNLSDCWMVGDILNDVEAGNRAGCRTILVDSGNETQWMLGPTRLPTYIADDLMDAADFIGKYEDRSRTEAHNIRMN